MKTVIAFLFGLTVMGCSAQLSPLVNAHAHNDYEHERPLLGALEQGFVSVEVDVHLIDGQLYVAHDVPASTEGLNTLDELYLAPLWAHIEKNQGQVYRGYQDFFYLMIDIKTPSETSYPVLREQLKQFAPMISVVSNGNDEQQKPVKVFISGFHGRPFNELLNDSVQYAGLDGRPEELDLNIPTALMPVISQNYNQYLNWDGQGEPDRQEVFKLVAMINKAHSQGKKVRLWAAPDEPVVWQYLLGLGIDLINTDKLSEFRQFALSRQ